MIITSNAIISRLPEERSFDINLLRPLWEAKSRIGVSPSKAVFISPLLRFDGQYGQLGKLSG